MKQTKAQLVKSLSTLHDQVRAIERQEWLTENAPKLGTCWKYRNCYSCPETDRDYWYCYARIKKVQPILTHFELLEFQCDKDGRLIVEYKKFGYLTGWERITEKEYLRAWVVFTKKFLAVQP